MYNIFIGENDNKSNHVKFSFHASDAKRYIDGFINGFSKKDGFHVDIEAFDKSIINDDVCVYTKNIYVKDSEENVNKYKIQVCCSVKDSFDGEFLGY